MFTSLKSRVFKPINFLCGLAMLWVQTATSQMQITQTVPPNNAESIVDPDSIWVQFSAAVNYQTVNDQSVRIFGIHSGAKVASFIPDTTNHALAIILNSPIHSGEKIMITFTSEVTSVDGDSLIPSWVMSYRAATGAGGTNFAPSIDATVHANPFSIVPGDLDEDGDLDLTISNFSPTAEIARNDGTGRFSIEESIPAPGGGEQTSPVDVDADGDLDFVVSAEGQEIVSSVINDGASGYVASEPIPVGKDPVQPRVSDLDGDGDLDVVVANYGASSLTILRNDGAGVLTISSTPAIGVSPSCFTLADLDNDGDVDIAATSVYSSTVDILMNDGAGSFSKSSSPIVGEISYWIVSGDIDGDSDVDLVVVKFGENLIRVLSNNGQGQFTVEPGVAVDTQPWTADIGDIDGDSDLDVVVTHVGNTIKLLKNDGSGQLTVSKTFIVGTDPRSVALGDFSGDGLIDIVFASKAIGRLSALIQRPSQAKIALSPFDLEFGPVPVGSYRELSITIGNEGGDSSLLVQDMVVSGSHFGVVGPTSVSVAALSDVAISLRFLPDSLGMYFDTLTITSSDPVTPFIRVPLRGKGAARPHAATLQDVTISSSGRTPSSQVEFSIATSTDEDGTIDSVSWFVNGSYVSSEATFIHSFGTGTSVVTLAVIDDDGLSDSSTARVHRTLFRTNYSNRILSGFSLYGSDNLVFIRTSDSLSIANLDGFVTTSIPIAGNVMSSVSLSTDGVAYVGDTSGMLHALSVVGSSSWESVSAGGPITAIPVVDSLSNALYVVREDGALTGFNRLTGAVVWSYATSGPIKSPAVISNSRRLIAVTESGVLNAFDLNLPGPSSSPQWVISLGDSISGAPALDNEGRVYLALRHGRVVRLRLRENQPPSIEWNTLLSQSFASSPVIGRNGSLYIASNQGRLYSIRISDGTVEWTFQTSGAIRTTPAISDGGIVYFGNEKGEFFAVDSSKTVLWSYQDTLSFSGPVLYADGAAYVTTEEGYGVAFFDGTPGPKGKPVWGTYQADNRRSGVFDGPVLTGVNSYLNEIPSSFEISANFPNPFNPGTSFVIRIPRKSRASLEVFDLVGRRVTTVLDSELGAGVHIVNWNAERMPTGTYFYRFTNPEGMHSGRMQLIK